jgi:hypothetical protein
LYTTTVWTSYVAIGSNLNKKWDWLLIIGIVHFT